MGRLAFLLLFLFLNLTLAAEDIPAWLPAGILQVETASVYKPGGLIKFVEKDGPDCGPFQLTIASFRRVEPSGDFNRMRTDMRYADKVARKLMVDLYDHEAGGDWFVVAAMWHAGPTGYKRHTTTARAEATRIRNVGQSMTANAPLARNP